MITIYIPDEFTTFNNYILAERTNLHHGASIKKVETRRVMYWARNIKPIENYPVTIYFQWVRKNTRTDPDNIAQAKKYVLDGLVAAGVLKDDAWKYISGFHDTFAIDQKSQGVIVTIDEAKK